MTPQQFDELIADISARTHSVRGWLTDREIRMLATLAACPTAEGEILEIGTYRGRSAIVLAIASANVDDARITAIDPLCNPMPGDGAISAGQQELETNLQAAGVAHRIDLQVTTSQDYLSRMDRALRLLWIDGDHGYEGASFDMKEYSKFVVDGGIVACHDILSPFGCTQAFKELIVDNPHYGPVGFCGSIGWAQFRHDPKDVAEFAQQKQSISRRLDPLCRLTEKAKASKLQRALYRLHRFKIPHGDVSPNTWTPLAA